MTPYCTLAEAKRELKANTPADDTKMLENIRTVTARIDGEFFQRRPLFAPYIEAREFLVTADKVNTWQNTFRFAGHLLAASAITLGTTTLTIGTDVELWPPLQSPATM